MKVRQSASLVAAVCTLCVAASGSVTPLPVAAAADTTSAPKPVVARPFELTASVDPLSTLVSLPFQSYILVQEAVAGVLGGANGLGGLGSSSLQGLPAIIYQAITQPTATSNLQTLGAALQTALGTEQTAITNLGTLPARLLALLTPVTGTSLTANSLAATPTIQAAAVTPAAATVDPLSALVSLPFQNYINQAITQPTATSNLQTLGASFQTALGTEQTALQNLATLPSRLIATDTAALSGLSAANTLASPLKVADTVAPTAKRVSLPDLDAPSLPSIKNPLSSLTTATSKTKVKADSVADAGTDGGNTPTKPADSTKKSGNPVSNAVKALNKAAKDAGYTGKHRADDSNGSKSGDSSSKGAGAGKSKGGK